LSHILLGLQVFPTAHIMVTGHTSLEGTETYNQRLSQRRAEAVRTYMQLHGVDTGRIHILSMGEFSPAVSEPNEPQRGALRIPANELIRDRNRRAEVVFYDPSGTVNFLPRMAPMELSIPPLSLPVNRIRFSLLGEYL
jgi:outer membrane protein OmpA-like peptidoglycan-associated protein